MNQDEREIRTLWREHQDSELRRRRQLGHCTHSAPKYDRCTSEDGGDVLVCGLCGATGTMSHEADPGFEVDLPPHTNWLKLGMPDAGPAGPGYAWSGPRRSNPR